MYLDERREKAVQELVDAGTHMVDVLMRFAVDMSRCTCAAHEQIDRLTDARKHVENHMVDFLSANDECVARSMFGSEESVKAATLQLLRLVVIWSRDQTETFLGVK